MARTVSTMITDGPLGPELPETTGGTRNPDRPAEAERIHTDRGADHPYRLIIELMNEGAATVSPRGVILDANARLAAMVGKPVTELVGSAAAELAPEAKRTAFAQLIDVGAGGSVRGEAELAGAGGTAIPVLVAVGAFEHDGSILRYAVITDLTGQRQAEAEVRALSADLELRLASRTADLMRANQNLAEFTRSVSHDLRAPLRAMGGFSLALVEEYGDRLDETGRDYAQRIQAGSERMSALINDLLALSSVSQAEMHIEPVDISLEVASIAEDLHSQEPDRNVRFKIQKGVRAVADRRLIRTALENLLGNAWKFTSGRAQACIEFGTTPTDDAAVCCYVRDDGAGFDSAYVGRLFRPFERLHSTSEFPGTGIGLASVLRIVERHGGRVWAEGAVDHGATFYFTLDAEVARVGAIRRN